MKTMTTTMLWLLLIVGTTSAWNVTFESQSVTIHMHETHCVSFVAPVTEEDVESGVLTVTSTQTNVAYVNEIPTLNSDDVDDSSWRSCVNVTARFLGSADVLMTISSSEGTKSSDPLRVIVIREERVIDTVFTASVATLVSLLYINFGCAMNWSTCRTTLRRPVGPAIGFVCQFLYMPLLSYGLGLLLFPTDPEMQIGMFFYGVSPGGGASNIWTVILGGNLDLSVTMTTISTLAAFGMMPLWIFTLGATIFDRAELGVPYSRIAMFAVGLIVPLAIGFFIQKKVPRLCKLLVKILKPFSTMLIVGIVVFAIVTNLYIFELFSWQIVFAGMGIPWLGYTFGWLLAFFCRQPFPDVTAISVETGVQNMGIAVFLLRFSLPQPAADLTTIIPVACSIMTPIPLTILFIIKSICDWRKKTAFKNELVTCEHSAPVGSDIEKSNTTENS